MFDWGFVAVVVSWGVWNERLASANGVGAGDRGLALLMRGGGSSTAATRLPDHVVRRPGVCARRVVAPNVDRGWRGGYKYAMASISRHGSPLPAGSPVHVASTDADGVRVGELDDLTVARNFSRDVKIACDELYANPFSHSARKALLALITNAIGPDAAYRRVMTRKLSSLPKAPVMIDPRSRPSRRHRHP